MPSIKTRVGSGKVNLSAPVNAGRSSYWQELLHCRALARLRIHRIGVQLNVYSILLLRT